MMKSIKRMSKIAIYLILFLLPAMELFAQQGQGGTESNLSMGFGARAFSVGRAFTAIADDPTAVFWNPAGLEFVYQQSATFFHTSLFEGTNYDFLGYALPTLNLGTFGLGVARIGIGGIRQTDVFNTDLGVFSWEEYHGFFSYAKKLPWDLTTGLTIRLVRRAWSGLVDQGSLVDMGVGMDLGFMYRPQIYTNVLLRDWSVGLNLRNLFAPQVKEGDNVDEFPLTVRFGLMRRILMKGFGNQFNVMLDFDYSQKRDLLIHVGAEYKFRNLAMVRLGMDGSSPTFGAGVKYSIFQIDYAFSSSPYSDVFSSVHRFSVSLNFGPTRDDLFKLAEARKRAEEEKLIAAIREADRKKMIKQHLEQGDKFFQEGQYLDAIVEYQQVLSYDAFNQKAKVMLDSADALLQKRFEEEREKTIKLALDKERAELDRQFIQKHFERGKTYLNNNQFTQALIEFNLALERAPEDPTILQAIQTTKRRLNEELNRLVTKIREEFRKGNYSEALRLVGEARLLGADNQALQNEIETLSQRIKVQETIQRGLSFFELGEYDLALKVFEEALRLNPENELVKQYYEKARIESRSKQEELDPAAEKRFLQGVDMFVKGKYQQAIDIWQEILKDYPYNKKVLTAIENARERLKKTK
ncbi:Tetratricopeptide repeat-containing protein [Caldithrix abyssi DSM 13497]|uniref:Tetratricopeptide repeat-containing protein n=2 Tax=Caldithrix abyssi DSM 13497 TaxID=880073 RepID=A0A1J1CC68_CALAY|nr:Tetratricopeptide repeat-containing protein [Caldithrix abyssi DSM 13497]